ncbi:MAG: hypothetical protein SFZ02_20670 [bacterium]|nr:hypothetical protein [bacterium]
MLKQIDIQKTPMTLEQLLEQLSVGDEIMLLRNDAPIAHIIMPISRVIDSEEAEKVTSDELSSDPLIGSLAHIIQILNDADDDVDPDDLLDASDLDDILRSEFGEYLHKRMNHGHDE